MHVDPTRLALLLFVMEWWPLLLALPLAPLVYWHGVRTGRKHRDNGIAK